MAQTWDEILSEPIAQLKPDAPAADGGWRAVRPLQEVSPRSQQPPATMSDGASLLSLKQPIQAEEDQPVSAPPPPSLTEQLSLTWANRRTRARPDPGFDQASSREPTPAPVEEAPPRAKTPSTWLQPLKRLASRLQGKPQPVAEAPPATKDEAPLTQTPARRRPTTEPAPSGHSSPARREPVSPELPAAPQTETPPADPDIQAPDAPKSLPLTLAQPHQVGSVPDPSPIPAQPTPTRPINPSPEQRVTPSVIHESPAEVPTGARQQPAGILRRLVHRMRPVTASPVTQPAPQPAAAPPVVETRPQAARPVAAAPLPNSTTPPESPAEQGEALSPVTRARMEGLLDVPLRDVRVFRGSVSHRLTQGLGAHAVTTGDQVHLAPHQGTPATPSGEALIAHELSHYSARQAPGKGLTPEVEETRARAIEHAVQRRAESPAPAMAAKTTAPSLTHRLGATAAAPSTLRLNVVAPPAQYHSTLASSPSLSPGSSAPAAIARAPMDRLPPMPESSGTAYSGNTSTLMSKENPYGPESPAEPARDEAGLIDRVVEAVLRRVRRESLLDRERRGAFRSEIGG